MSKVIASSVQRSIPVQTERKVSIPPRGSRLTYLELLHVNGSSKRLDVFEEIRGEGVDVDVCANLAEFTPNFLLLVRHGGESLEVRVGGENPGCDPSGN